MLKKCLFIVAMVTGQLLGLQGWGGGVLIKLERPLYLEKSLPYGIVEKKLTIWHILYYFAQLVTDMDYRAPTTCSLFENNVYSLEFTEEK